MKTSILSTLVMASLLLFVAGCEKESLLGHQPEKNPGTPAVGNRTLTLSAEMPSDGPTTRIALTQVGKRIDMAWEMGDVLELCFVQGIRKVKSMASVSSISPDGKKASFTIGIPDGITEGTFDLYGVYGGNGLSNDDPTIAVLPGIGGPGSLSSLSDREDAMLIFSSLGIQTSNPQVSVTFRHIGALFCITLKNENSVAMNDLGSLRLVSASGGNWAYNNTGGGSYDLVNDAFQGTGSAGDYLSFIAPESNLPSGETLSIWGWFPPLPTAVWPELSLEIRDGWNAVRVTSDNSKPARSSALSTGKSYYFYAMWDGDALMFTDSTFTLPPELKDLTLTGNLRHAGSGTDFLGMTYLRSDSIYYNEAKEPGVWTGEVLVGRGSDPRVAIDGDDNPHVVYTTLDGKIAYRTRSGGTWSDAVYIESNNAGTCSMSDIAVDGNGYAHITYTDTRGNVGNYTDSQDIMYAVNSTGSFVKTLIWNGYYEDYGGGSGGADYYLKGSRIAVDAVGQYYIMAHHRNYYKWMGGNDTYYYVSVMSSGGASGSTSGTYKSDQEDIFDLDFDGTNIIGFYKAGGVNQSAALSVSGASISFTSVQNVTTAISNNYQNPGTLVVIPDVRGLGGITSAEGKFFAKLGPDEMIIDEFVVKPGTVPVVLVMAGTAYAVFTDTSGTTRIGKNE
ncbi:MAG: hypothetical protein ACK5JU_05285 [Bacteroidales bacterium]